MIIVVVYYPYTADSAQTHKKYDQTMEKLRAAIEWNSKHT